MKKTIFNIVNVIVFTAIIYFVKNWVVLIVLLLLLLVLWDFAGKRFFKSEPKDVAPEPAPEPEGIETAIDNDLVQYGEPDDVIVIDPTRGNEPDGVILAYDTKGFLYYNGTIINKSEIREVTFHNAAIPYFVPDYQIIIATTSEAHPNVNIKVGSDLEIVKDVLVQIKSHLDVK
jgi:hypothetical protein